MFFPTRVPLPLVFPYRYMHMSSHPAALNL